jgi:predicted ArsR family transcriptional regulator
MHSTTDATILALLDQRDGEISGIEDLAVVELNTSNVNYVRQRLAKLEADGELTVIHLPPGRGRKARIRRVQPKWRIR